MTATSKKPAATGTSQTLPQHSVTVSFGRTNKDNAPAKLTLTLDQMAAQFSVPDLTRGKLPLADYLALDKKIPAQKLLRDAEKDGRYFIMAAFKNDGT